MAFLPAHTSWGLDSRGDDWRDLAACRGVDPELMWPLSDVGPQVDLARAVCRRCPGGVVAQCLQDGYEADDWKSIRGGLVGKQRVKLHRNGFRPSEYLANAVREPRMQRCRRCHSSFEFDPESPYARLCLLCRRRPVSA